MHGVADAWSLALFSFFFFKSKLWDFVKIVAIDNRRVTMDLVQL